MKMTVVIPTYRRPDDLDRCLRGVAEQKRPADQVLVTIRSEDRESLLVTERWSTSLPLESIIVPIPGVVQALNLALDEVSGDIITITDDDTFALDDWLQRIEQHFMDDPLLGGLGGRDLNHEHGRILPAVDDRVGIILPYGRILGNHHSGRGPAREVDALKGVNMSWRMSAIQGLHFDNTLRGKGAQVYFELAFSLDVQRRGWRLVYDPSIQVHHYVAQRFDNDNRAQRDLSALENSAFNLYASLRRYMKPGRRRTMALLWAQYVGVFGHPGVLRGLYFLLKRDEKGIALRKVTAKAWRDAKQIKAS
jgi:cellulose synthase/poly-beta-1,6-N-acetylglucosamine synthase-like glycosyltransferase